MVASSFRWETGTQIWCCDLHAELLNCNTGSVIKCIGGDFVDYFSLCQNGHIPYHWRVGCLHLGSHGHLCDGGDGVVRLGLQVNEGFKFGKQGQDIIHPVKGSFDMGHKTGAWCLGNGSCAEVTVMGQNLAQDGYRGIRI